MKVIIKIPDLTCENCKITIENTLKTLSDVDEFQVDLSGKQVQISGSFEVSQIIESIRSAGYHPAEILSLKV
jgi:copper chaperone CopZ